VQPHQQVAAAVLFGFNANVFISFNGGQDLLQELSVLDAFFGRLPQQIQAQWTNGHLI